LNVDFSDGWDLIYQDTKITRRDWPKLMILAAKASIRLTLMKRYASLLPLSTELTIPRDEDEGGNEEDESSSSSSSDDDDDADLVAQTDQNTQENSAGIVGMKRIPTIVTSAPEAPPFKRIETNPEGESSESWHVFSLMATDVAQVNSASQTSFHSATLPFDDHVLLQDMDEIDLYLSSTNKRLGESEAYRSCDATSFHEIKDYINSLPNDPTDAQRVNHHRSQLVRSAREILSFFFPPKVDHVVIRKYWGAVYRILKDDSIVKSQSRFHHMVKTIHNLAHVVRDLKEELFSKRDPTHNQTNVPHEFIQAFLMCHMYLVLFTTEHADGSRKYPKRCKALLTQGKLKVIQRLQTVCLRDKEAVSPLGVATQLLGQLLQEVRGGPLFPDRHQLASEYWEYLKKLVSSFTFFTSTSILTLNRQWLSSMIL
jgi:hypothetical protein